MDTMDDVINQVHALEARVAELELRARLAEMELRARAVLQRKEEALTRSLADSKRLIERIGQLALMHGYAWSEADVDEALEVLDALDGRVRAALETLETLGPLRLYYFGVAKGDRAGHYWLNSQSQRINGTYLPAFPWKDIDQMFAPHTRAPHERKLYVGRVTLFRGWTVLAWWDGSGDNRPGSNSALVAEGRFSFDEMVAAGREQYPWVFERLRERLREED